MPEYKKIYTVDQAVRLYSKERSKLLDGLISEIMPNVKKLNLVRNRMSDEDLKWLLMISAVDYITQNVNGYDITCRVHDEVETGRLTVPKDPEKSTIAMWLVLY